MDVMAKDAAFVYIYDRRKRKSVESSCVLSVSKSGEIGEHHEIKHRRG